MGSNYTAIVCINSNNVIGRDGKLLYNIKADMANFKSLTMGNVVIMGRKTFESLPNRKPLSNRINIIVTSNLDYRLNTSNWEKNDFNSTYIVNSLQEADELCKKYFSDRELFIIGGGMIYQKSYDLGMIDKAIVTLVSDDEGGDSYFPELDKDYRYKVIFKTTTLRDHPNDVYYKYIIYKKK